MRARAFLLLLVAAATASAGPLPASYRPIDASRTMWISPAMSLPKADQEWRALVDRPGLVPVIVADKPEPPEAEAPPRAKPLTLAAAHARLVKQRQARQAFLEKALASKPEVSTETARAYRLQWTTWQRARATATITAEDREDAADLLVEDAKGVDLEGKPRQFYVLVYRAGVDAVITQYDDDAMRGAEFAPVLARWHAQYGARPYEWDGYQWTLDVPRPPTRVAELRALADEFALACPFDRSGRYEVATAEPPGALMARLEQKRWVCYWSAE